MTKNVFMDFPSKSQLLRKTQTKQIKTVVTAVWTSPGPRQDRKPAENVQKQNKQAWVGDAYLPRVADAPAAGTAAVSAAAEASRIF